MEANSREDYVWRQPYMDRNHILPYKRNKNGDYLVSRIEVQPRLLKVLKDLPVCTGVGVRRDVVGIEEFYSILSGETVELN